MAVKFSNLLNFKSFGFPESSSSSSSFSFLLDDFPGASIGYSVSRKLSSTYTGQCIKVRRSSDNLQQDIGFLANVLDQDALLLFVGAGDGFITKIYDQSGNSNHLIQATVASQPKIVTSGVVNITNSKPSALFDGSNDFMTLTTPISRSTPWCTFQVSKRSATLKNDSFIGGQSGGDLYSTVIFLDNSVDAYGSEGYLISAGTDSTADQNIMSTVWVASTKKMYKNGGAIPDGNVQPIPSENNFEQINKILTLYSSGTLQELILYKSDKSANRVDIENEINEFYNIATKRVYFLGDSFAVGIGASPRWNNRYTTLLSENKGWQEINVAQSAYSINQLATLHTSFDLVPTKAFGDYKLCFFWSLFNDIAPMADQGTNPSLSRTMSDYQIFIDLALARGWSRSDIIMSNGYYGIDDPPHTDMTLYFTFIAAAQALATTNSILYVDNYQYEADNGGDTLIVSAVPVINIHPNNAGHSTISVNLIANIPS